jgi:hypothetical protein
MVMELGIILIVLMGWPFAAAEYLGGLLMVIILALLFHLTLGPRLVHMARTTRSAAHWTAWKGTPGWT